MWYASYELDLTQQNWVTLLSPICAWLYLIRTTILESMLQCLSVFWYTSVVSWYHLYAVLLLRLLHLKVYFGKSWHLWRISFDWQWWLAIFAIWLLIVIQKFKIVYHLDLWASLLFWCHFKENWFFIHSIHSFIPFIHSFIHWFSRWLVHWSIDSVIQWWCCWLGIRKDGWPATVVSEMTCTVSSGTLNSSIPYYTRVPTHLGKSWIVLKFKKEIFQAWKVMENDRGHGKFWNSTSRSWNFLGAYCITSLTLKFKKTIQNYNI